MVLQHVFHCIFEVYFIQNYFQGFHISQLQNVELFTCGARFVQLRRYRKQMDKN